MLCHRGFLTSHQSVMWGNYDSNLVLSLFQLMAEPENEEFELLVLW